MKISNIHYWAFSKVSIFKIVDKVTDLTFLPFIKPKQKKKTITINYISCLLNNKEKANTVGARFLCTKEPIINKVVQD